MTPVQPADRLEEETFTIDRTFAAPRGTVFKLWTDPAYVAEWWGIEGSTNPVCELDVRPGGRWRIDMRTRSGRVYRNQGVYLEVVENVRLVYTDIPDPTLPEWNGTPPAPSVHTVTFADRGEGTFVTLEVRLSSRTDRDRMLKLGARTGIGQGFDRLERLLEREAAMKNPKTGGPAEGVDGTVISKDGTVIAFKRFGRGPSLVLVGGAFNDSHAPASGAPLASLLSATFTVYAYDRRGRGASGDTPPYAVAREVEDLAAIIVEAGGTAFVHGMSSGGALALKAAASGLAIGKLSLYEPPFSADSGAEERAKAYAQALAGLLAAGRRGDAAALFMAHVGMPTPMIQGMRGAPMWPALETMAPTLAYDSAVMGDEAGAGVPADVIARVKVPCLVMGGGASPVWMRTIGKAVADSLPRGRYTVLAGQTHDVSIDALAPGLQDFFSSDA